VNELRSQADADELLSRFGAFHDSCLHEAHVWSDHYVYSDLRMHCTGDLDTRVRLVIQRQVSGLSAVELLFEQVLTFHLQPSPQDYDSIIFGATMLHRGEAFYWADVEGWSPESADRDDATWIAARKVSWRDASKWMGSELRFGPHEEFDP